MNFIYKEWENCCRKLKENNIISITISETLTNKKHENFLVFKHDVETSVKRALKLAKIEKKYGHKGSYYIQAYLLEKKENLMMLKEIQNLGHEVSYHHDVMDSNKGDLKKAKIEFIEKLELFEKNGFKVKTVCQHGNPVIERKGYFSNRDFFRDVSVSEKFKHITEVMVNYRKNLNKDYKYFSDSGYNWSLIYDPENNDRINSDDKNLKYNNLDFIFKYLNNGSSIIVSTHPHRWQNSIIFYRGRKLFFGIIKRIVKILIKNSFLKKLFSKFYRFSKII